MVGRILQHGQCSILKTTGYDDSGVQARVAVIGGISNGRALLNIGKIFMGCR